MADKLVSSKCVKACVDSCPSQAQKAPSKRGKGQFQSFMKTCIRKVLEPAPGKPSISQKEAFGRCVAAWKRAKEQGRIRTKSKA